MTGESELIEKNKIVKDKLWTKTYLLFIFMYFGNVSCLYYYNGTMTLIGESLSGSVVMAGFLSSVYSLVPLFFRPFVGSVIDKYGRWKSNCAGIVITFATIVGYLFAGNIYQLIALRAIGGLAFCITSTANYTSASDLIPESRKTEGLGWFQNMGTISTYIGPALALYALTLMPNSYVGLHIGGMILCGFAFVMNLFINYEKDPEYIQKRQEALKAEQNARKVDGQAEATEVSEAGHYILGLQFRTWFLVMAMLLVTCAHSTVNSYFILSADKRGITGISNFFLFMAAGMFIARAFISRLADEKGMLKVYVPILAIGSACLVILGSFDNVMLLNIAAFPYGFLFGTSAAVCQSNIVKSAPMKKQAFANSMYLIAVDVGYGVFPIISGMIIKSVGYAHIFLVAAVLPIVAIAFVIMFVMNQKKIR